MKSHVQCFLENKNNIVKDVAIRDKTCKLIYNNNLLNNSPIKLATVLNQEDIEAGIIMAYLELRTDYYVELAYEIWRFDDGEISYYFDVYTYEDDEEALIWSENNNTKIYDSIGSEEELLEYLTYYL